MLPKIVTDIPGPRSRELAERLRRVESRNVTYLDSDFPIFWERAEGANVWDVDGNCYLDLTSAFGVTGLGHRAPVLQKALMDQAQRLIHGMGDVHPTELKVRLCERLSEITFGRWHKLGRCAAERGRTILCGSGFESVEAALKTALLATKKSGVIAFRGGYHGLGYGALEVAGLPYFSEPFRAQLKDFATILPYPNCAQCTYNNDDDRECCRFRDGFPECTAECMERVKREIRAAIDERPIGAILLEPMQSRGGVVVPPKEFLRLIRRICDEKRILFIADEIYTGLHRTGPLFGCDHFEIAPDIICMGKALTGGFPLSACVGREEVMEAWPESPGEALHTSTYLGHPLGCAMALAALDEHFPVGAERAIGEGGEGGERDGLSVMVIERGERLRQALAKMKRPYFGRVRGVGLMLGLEVVHPESGAPDKTKAIEVVKTVLKRGLILLSSGPDGNVLAFSPTFDISDEQIAFVAGVIGAPSGAA